jgi:hypothetical protein
MPARAPSAVLALVVLVTPVARANVGPPSSGGQLVAEPAGLRDVHITRETLTIDLRPLADGQPGHVQAVYHLDNRGPERTLDLLFISGTPATAFDVRLNDQPVPSASAPDAPLPSNWQPPPTTPGIDNKRDLAYLQSDRLPAVPQAFALTIPSGSHTLTVRYDAEAARHQAGGPTVTWQFAYVLAPARQWASFGGLDVEIQLPAGWRMASTPSLLRSGNVVRSHFDKLPATALALTVRAAPGASYVPLLYGGWIVFGLAGLVGAVACAHSGWWYGRRRMPAGLRVAVMAVLWGVALLAAGAFAVFGRNLAIPAAQQNHDGYGQSVVLLVTMVLGALAVPVGFALGMICNARGRRQPVLYTD